MIVAQKDGGNSLLYLEIIKLKKNFLKDIIVKIIKVKNIIYQEIKNCG